MHMDLGDLDWKIKYCVMYLFKYTYLILVQETNFLTFYFQKWVYCKNPRKVKWVITKILASI